MDYTFNKTLLVILSLSSLLLSSNAVPSTRVNDFISTSVPAAAPTSTSLPAEAPSSFEQHEYQYVDPETAPIEYPDAPAIDPDFCNRAPESRACQPPINITNVDPEIVKTCDGEPYGSLIPDCIANISKIFEGRPFDVVEALEIQVNTTANTIKDIFDVIVKCRKTPNNNKRGMEVVDICHDQYHMMLDSINQTLEIIRQQNFVDAYNKVDELLSYREACGRVVIDSVGVPKPWDNVMPWDEIEDLRQMIYICVNILSNIVNNHKF